MAIAAIIPAANMQAANDTLEAQGYGPGNFSVALYKDSVGPDHAGLHFGADPDAFHDAIKALPNVVTSEIAGTGQERFRDCAAQAGCTWGNDFPPLKGVVAPGFYTDGDVVWKVIQQYDTAVYPDPTAIPALVRRARRPGEVPEWVQPIDQFDAYRLVNPFTGEPDVVTHDGQTWRVTQADGSGNNVWEPGVFGWTVVGEEPEPDQPIPADAPEWAQPIGGHDAYNTGARVTHNGSTWESTIDANVWEPGVFGWVVV